MLMESLEQKLTTEMLTTTIWEKLSESELIDTNEEKRFSQEEIRYALRSDVS